MPEPTTTTKVSHAKHGASRYRSKPPAACRCDICRAGNTALQHREKARRKAQLAEKFAELPHGTKSTYLNWGCRCAECTAAHSEECRRQRVTRIERMKTGSPDVPHGTVTGYSSWGCRCDLCRAANRIADQKRRHPAS